MMTVLTLSFFAFIAGLLDAMVGGGGLIQLPALLVVLPTTPPALLFGTNKLASFAGTLVAVRQFARSVEIPWQGLWKGTAAALIGSFLGARTVSLINPQVLKPIVLLLIIGMLIYTAKKKDFGSVSSSQVTERAREVRTVILGSSIGFYDGFFGPGTGSFFIMGLIAWCGYDFLRASAAAKLLNAGTNLAALAFFFWTDSILYELAIPMAIANASGAYIGSHLAIAKGSRFVRVVFLLVCSLLAVRLGYDLAPASFIFDQK